MDDLILTFSANKLDDDNHTQLIRIKREVEEALISTKTDIELTFLYEKVYTFNLFIQSQVSFNKNLYTDSEIMYKIASKCEEYYSASLNGTIRERLLNILNFYNYILMAVLMTHY